MSVIIKNDMQSGEHIIVASYCDEINSIEEVVLDHCTKNNLESLEIRIFSERTSSVSVQQPGLTQVGSIEVGLEDSNYVITHKNLAGEVLPVPDLSIERFYTSVNGNPEEETDEAIEERLKNRLAIAVRYMRGVITEKEFGLICGIDRYFKYLGTQLQGHMTAINDLDLAVIGDYSYGQLHSEVFKNSAMATANRKFYKENKWNEES